MKIVGFKLDTVGNVRFCDAFNGSEPVLVLESLLGRYSVYIQPEFRFGYQSLYVNAGMITFHIPVKGCGVEKSLSTGILKSVYNAESDDTSRYIIKKFSSAADTWYKVSAEAVDKEEMGG